jgi:hypothetical protein
MGVYVVGGVSFLPKSVIVLEEPTWETRANMRRETDLQIWQCARLAPGELTPSPEGWWPTTVPSGLARCIEFSSQAWLAQYPEGTWAASIAFDPTSFKVINLPSADRALATLHTKVAGCPLYERLARPVLTIEEQDRLGKKVRTVTLVSLHRRCDECSVRNTVRLCQ